MMAKKMSRREGAIISSLYLFFSAFSITLMQDIQDADGRENNIGKA